MERKEELVRILVYGKGWIAEKVLDYLEKESISFSVGQSRVDNVEETRKEILLTKATHVMCLIGRTHGKVGVKEWTTIDYLEQPGKLKENVRDNLFAPVSLALTCAELGVHLNYLGTGCIFNYDDCHDEVKGFTENETPNFFGSSYSTVKGFTDRLMHQLPVANCRIRMPITDEIHPRNFITKITNYSKICSMANSMTVLDDLIPVFVRLSLCKFTGTINLTNPGVISHNEILEMYKEIVDPNFNWENFSYDDQVKILASGRSNNCLDTTLLQALYPEVSDIKTSIRKVLERMTLKNKV